MNSRNDIPAFLNERGLIDEGVEIGVRRGDFSRMILRTWEGDHLYMVDPYRADLPHLHDVVSRVAQDEMWRWRRQAERVAAFFKGKATVAAVTSETVATDPRLYDAHFDFVHLDANHGYDPDGNWGIVQDLRIWHPKLKSGGLFSGHDYYNAACNPDGTPDIVADESEANLQAYGVKKAVDEFAAEIGVEVQVMTGDKLPSWWWIKP